MTRHPVWYVPNSPAASLLTGLPADFERRPLADLTLLAGAEPPGVLVVDAAGGEASALARAAAQGAGMPVVALVDAHVPETVAGHSCYAYLSSSVSPPMLAAVLREACKGARVRAGTRESDTQLEELTAIGIRLSAERDLDALLELILTKGREITRSDAGSLYVVEKTPDDSQCLRFKLAQNDSVQVPFSESTLPISAESVAGFVALLPDIKRYIRINTM